MRQFLLVFAAFVALAQGQARVRLAMQAQRGGSIHTALLTMSQKWRQAPGGGVELTIYTDGTMGGESEIVRRMRIGQIQAAVLTVVGLAEIDDSVKALQAMPMMFRSLDEVDYVTHKLTPRITQKFSDKGVVILGWGDVGWVRYFSKEPLLHPEELKKRKVFAWAGDRQQIDLMKALGHQPVPLEINDVLPGLRTGLIEAASTIPFYALAGQIYGAAPHMLEINWVPLVGALVMTRKAWEAFTPTQREILGRTAKDATEDLEARSRLENVTAVAAMKKRGLIVHPATPEMEAEWRKAAEEAYPKIRGGMVPAEMFDEVRRLLQEFRSTQGGPKS